ncbi:hypothetical protein ccrud_01575 [Corynebacterium crudilactis]|uniref:TadE-like protein n=2 Tax=Corynebacterium crudilactis TaxID=1652495 RepID=A0A172QQT0_9CORY|nr:hypothetical protein ccrud_01575 [Corynebacterium crudilactis]
MTVASAGIAAILISLFAALAWQAGNLVDKEQAQVAADLSAVAGAYAFARGDLPAVACTTAQHIAEANNAELHTCTTAGEDLTVVVAVRGQHARAKAGPL